MTEAEWLACEDSQPMLEFLRDKATDRKWRLVLCQQASLDLTLQSYNADAWKSIELGEQWADGQISDAEVAAFCRATRTGPGVWLSLVPEALKAVEILRSSYFIRNTPPILRDIFGNPFRPVTFASEWGTDTVVALARQMYESRDFSAMPILADALQDAGCEDENVLNHCREPGAHVRGCWIVDLVLGKE
jgi:hypothetical protein